MADKRDDDITDLTADKRAEGKGKSKKIKDKTKDKKKNKDKGKEAILAGVQQANEEKLGKKGKVKGEKKKGGKLLLTLLLILVPVVLIGAFVALLITNFFGVRNIVGGFIKEPLLKVVVWFDPGFSSVNEELNTKSNNFIAQLDIREKQLDNRETGIAQKEAELNERKQSLDTLESQLGRRGLALDKREEQINQLSKPKQPDNSTVPLYYREMTEDELAEMQSLSRTYAQMEPATAAGILAKLKDEKHIAALLYYMSERKASAILAVMETELAARITEILLYK